MCNVHYQLRLDVHIILIHIVMKHRSNVDIAHLLISIEMSVDFGL